MNTDIFKTGKAVIKFCGDFKIVLIFDGSNQTFLQPIFHRQLQLPDTYKYSPLDALMKG